MSIFASIPAELCLVMMTFLDVDSLLVFSSVEKYLHNILTKIETWQYLYRHRLPHQQVIPPLLQDLQREFWLSYRYRLVITDVEQYSLVVITKDLDTIKGCLLAYHHFIVQKPGLVDYNVGLDVTQPGLIAMTSNDVRTLIRPHLISRNKELSVEENMHGHHVDKVICDPYCHEMNRWYIQPFYLLDTTDEMKENLKSVLSHLGIKNVTITAQDIA